MSSEKPGTTVKSVSEPIRHKRRRIYSALYLLIAVCVCIAWAAPIRDMVTRRLWPRPDAGPRDAYSFIALAYTQPTRGASRDSSSIYQHIDALAANGYVPITMTDVINLLHRGKPVPRKSILLTADVRHPNFLHDLRGAVRRYGWSGVAFFDTESLGGSSPSGLNWKALRALEKSDEWDIGLQGHNASLSVPSSIEKKEARFLTSRMWLKEEGRVENSAEFATRVRTDYETAYAMASIHLAKPPVAFAYPYGDFGQFTQPDEPAQTANLAASATFDAAFTLGAIGRNTMFTDRLRINRLAVDPAWAANDLLEAINTANRAVESVEDIDLSYKATGWVTDWGESAIGGSGLILRDAKGSGGARAWLGGSDVRRDLSATVEFQLTEGKLSIFARTTPNMAGYLRIDIDRDGHALLQQKSLLTSDPVTLAQARTHIQTNATHRLAIMLRDSNVNVSIDGQPLFNTREQAVCVKEAGSFGIAVSTTPTDSHASLTVNSVTLQSRRSTLASWNFDEALDPFALAWIKAHGSRLTEISPPLVRVKDYGMSNRSIGQSENIYRLLASIYNLRLTPCLRISSESELETWSPIALAGALSDLDCDGIYVNFENYDTFQINALERWLRQTGKMLSGSGRPVLVRLPRMLERLSSVYALLAAIPSVELVTDAGLLMPVASVQAKQIVEERIATPTDDEMKALPPIFTVEETMTDKLSKTIGMQIRELIDAGENAFRDGNYEMAIAAFSEWNRLAPTSPTPSHRIGDALINLGYHDEASGFYRQSLVLDPSQIKLATRYAQLLNDTGRKIEARHILNTYARLFPESTDILLAQAEWLYRENRIEEASERAERILRSSPDHFDTILFMLRIAETEEGRIRAIENLTRLGNTPEQQESLISAIWQHDLLTYQNSHLFVALMEQISRSTKDQRLKTLLSRLEPRSTAVTETFTTTLGLSDNWQPEGAIITADAGSITMQAEPVRNEFSARLLRSERWRDSFIEIRLDALEGGFWLYSRRSRSHLVRLGFDATGNRLNIQVWKGRNNDVVASQFIPWSFPEGGCTLRLEIRGKGITGMVDGKSVFDFPLALPEDFGPGWTAFAVNAEARGTAMARLSSLSSGPLPMRIAMTPSAPSVDEQGVNQTEQLRRLLPVLTDVSPDWFTVKSTGEWVSTLNEEGDFYNLFARYYRLRLVPVVRVQRGAAVTATDIITICRTHRFDGLLLWFEAEPAAEWFTAMDRELNTPGLDVVAITAGAAPGTETIRGIAASRTLFKDYGSPVPLQSVSPDQIDITNSPDSKNATEPLMFRF